MDYNGVKLQFKVQNKNDSKVCLINNSFCLIRSFRANETSKSNKNTAALRSSRKKNQTG